MADGDLDEAGAAARCEAVQDRLRRRFPDGPEFLRQSRLHLGPDRAAAPEQRFRRDDEVRLQLAVPARDVERKAAARRIVRTEPRALDGDEAVRHGGRERGEPRATSRAEPSPERRRGGEESGGTGRYRGGAVNN